jgi:hypothetical protein
LLFTVRVIALIVLKPTFRGKNYPQQYNSFNNNRVAG